MITASCAQLTAFIAEAPDTALTASGSYDERTVYTGVVDYGPTLSRLFTTDVAGVSVAGWSAYDAVDLNQYIQVRTPAHSPRDLFQHFHDCAIKSETQRCLYVLLVVSERKQNVMRYLLSSNISSIQVDLQQIKYIVKIATQCRGVFPEAVSSYYVKVSSTTADDVFTDVCGFESCPQLFIGNEDQVDADNVVTNEFDWPIAARFVRLNPQSWLGWPSLRWEVYGCDSI